MTVTIEKTRLDYGGYDAWCYRITIDNASKEDIWLREDNGRRWYSYLSNVAAGTTFFYVKKDQLNAFIKEFYGGETLADKLNATNESTNQLVENYTNAVERSNTKTYECRYIPVAFQQVGFFKVYNVTDGHCEYVGNATTCSRGNAVPREVGEKVYEALDGGMYKTFRVTVPTASVPVKPVKPLVVFKAKNKKTGGFYRSTTRDTWTRLRDLSVSLGYSNESWDVIEYELVEKRRGTVRELCKRNEKK